MATERYINECKNMANANRLAKFELQNWDRAELEGTGNTFQQTYTGKNMNIYPYNGSGNGNGITFTLNNDGTMIVNGKNNNNGNSAFMFYNNNNNPRILGAGDYYFIKPNNTNIGFVMQDTNSKYYNFTNSNNYHIRLDEQKSIKLIYIQILKGNTTQFNNEKVYPMLSMYSDQTNEDYEPYCGEVPSPNPEYPQDIINVTGEQNILVQDGTIPKEYIQVEYIESTGTEYIDTGVIPTENTKIDIDFAFVNSTFGGWTPILGSRYQTNNYALFVNTDSLKIATNYGSFDSGFSSTTIIEKNKKYNFKNIEGQFYLDGELKNDISTTQEIGTTVKSIWLCDLHQQNDKGMGRSTQARIYQCKFYNGDTLIRNMIPCYRNSDKEVGLYDVVNNVFYTNQGTGSFTYGQVLGTTYKANLYKNLLDYSTMIDGYVTYTGAVTNVHTMGEMCSDFIKIKPNTTYTFKIFETSSTYDNWFGIGEYASNNQSSFLRRDAEITGTRGYCIFTTSSTTNYIRVSARNLKSATKVQLELGEATSYSPYFTPIELNKIGDYKDSIKKSTGKNLFDGTIYKENYVINSSGVESYNTSFNLYKISLKPNTTYTIQFKSTDSAIRSSRYIAYKNDGTFISMIAEFTYNAGESVTQTFTTPNETSYILYHIGKLVENVMLEQNSQATTYEPYGKVWYIHKETGKIELTGNETWNNFSTGNIYRYYTNAYQDEIKGLPTTTTGYCNYLPFSGASANPQSVGFAYNVSTGTTTTNGNLTLITTGYYQTWTDLTNWLKTVKPVIYYQLATPKYTVITNTELINQLETLYGALQDENAKNIFIDSEDLPIELDMKYFKGGVQIEDDNRFLEINQSNHLVSIELQDNSYVNDTIIGATFTPSAEVQLLNMPADTEYIGKKIIPKIGVKYAENDVEYITFDDYTIESVNDEQTSSNTKFSAMNGGTLLDKEYECTLSFEGGATHTINDFYQDACEQLGLTPTDATFDNSEIELSGNPFTNKETLRTVISEVEKVSCNIAKFDWANETITLSWLSNQIDYTFNTSDYSTLEGNLTQVGPYNVIIVGNSQLDGENVASRDEESIALYGEHQIMVDSPYFLYNQALRSQAIEAIYNKLDGLTYFDLKLTTYFGKPFLEVGDKIRINTNENQVYDTYVLSHTFKFDGAFNSIIESPALTTEEQNYVNEVKGTSITDKIKRTEVIVDKVEGEIQGITTRVVEVEDGLGNTYTKEDTDKAIQTAKDGWTNTFTTNGGNNILRNTGLWFEDKSGREYLYPSNSMYPSDDLFLLAQPYFEYWKGYVVREKEDNAVNGNCLILQDGILQQEQQVKNGTYTLSFRYKIKDIYSTVKVNINDNETELTETEDTEFVETFEVSSKNIKLIFDSNANNSCEIYDLMLNIGGTKAEYSQNENETTTNTVNISKGITITSSNTYTTFKADSDGIRIYNSKDMSKVITDFTDVGMNTKKMVVEDEAKIIDLYFQKMSRNTWITKL